MERKKYLELCQQAAAGRAAKVLWERNEYFPKSYELSFDKSGHTVHLAKLKDVNANNSFVWVGLEEVEEVEK